MSLEYIFPDHTKRNRKIAIVVEVVMAVIAIVAIFWAINRYWLNAPAPPDTSSVAEDPYAAKRRALEQPNPQVVFTPEEIKAKEEALKQPNPTIRLTEEQASQRRAAIENI